MSTRMHRLLLLVVTAAVFWAGLRGDFLFDDYPNIVSNDKVHATRLDFDSLATAATAYDLEGGLNRPLATVWFAFDYYLGGGKPWIFKLSGLLVHLLNALLVFALLRQLLGLANAHNRPTPADSWVCLLLALVWAVHPLQVSSVLYIVQRMETLSISFVLLALLAYIAGRRRQISGERGWPFLVACLPLWALALACKESAILFPAYTLSLELTLLGFAAASPSAVRRWRWTYVAGASAGFLLFVFWALPRYASDAAYAIRDFTVWERLLTQCRILPMYLGQILLPLPQSMTFYYDDFALSHSLLDPVSTLLGVIVLLALLGSALALRRTIPLFALGIFWFFSAHLLTSNVVAFELVFEHRNYFALLGCALSIYALLSPMTKDLSTLLVRALMVLLVLGLGTLTALRSATWGDPFLLAVDLVAKNPRSPRAASDLASLYFGASHGDAASPYYELGVREFERAGTLPNASPVPDQGLIVMQSTVGLAAGDEVWNRLLEKLRSRPIGSQEMMSITGLLRLRETDHALDDGQLAQAYDIVLSRSNQPAEFYLRCATHALFRLGDQQRAQALLVKAVDLSPSGSKLPERIIQMLLSRGQPQLVSVIRARIASASVVTAPSGSAP